MPPNRQIQVPQLILGQRISPTLNHQRIRPIRPHNGLHDLSEQVEIGDVVDPSLERHVDGVVLADSLADLE